MEDIYKWIYGINAALKSIRYLHFVVCENDSISDAIESIEESKQYMVEVIGKTNIEHEPPCIEHLYNTLGLTDILCKIDQVMIPLCKDGRELVIKRIIRHATPMLVIIASEPRFRLNIPTREKEEREGVKVDDMFCDSVLAACQFFFYHLYILCSDMGNPLNKICPNEFSDTIIERIGRPDLGECNEWKAKDYKTLPRRQGVSSINQLLNRLGIKEGVKDKTLIAEFIEAVTGGNIDTIGKDTYAYKHLNDELALETKELFKKIGITL